VPESTDPAPGDVFLRGRSSGSELLQLARRDRQAARQAIRAMDTDQLVQACLDLRPEARNTFLMLADAPERLVPLLPPAELCVTVRATGMSEAAWLLEMATTEQRQACVDLDVWTGPGIVHERAVEWIDALIEAGRETLVRGIAELDPEFWVLALKRMADVVIVGREDERPEGFFTEDGVVYFRAHSDEDFARVKEIMQTAFAGSQPHYWNLVHGMLFELPTECEEFALRWRQGRLADLGFPERDWAMRVYRPLAPDQVETVDLASVGPGDAYAMVPGNVLPRQLRGTLVGTALSQLPADRASDILGYILGVANAIAVADGMRLSDSESVPRALERAVTGIDAGLRLLVHARSQEPEVVLEGTRPVDLFRLGFTHGAVGPAETDPGQRSSDA